MNARPFLTDPSAAESAAPGLLQALDRAYGVAELDLAGRVLWANDNFQRLLGRPAEDLVGVPYTQLCEPEDPQGAAEAQRWDAVLQGAAVRGDFRRPGPGKRDAWVQLCCSPVLDDQGRTVRVMCFAADITLRKQAEAELRKMQLALEMSNAAARIGTWEFDCDTRRLNLSASVFEVLRIDARGDVQAATERVVHQMPPALRDLAARALATGNGWDADLTMGDARWVRVVGRAEYRHGRVRRLYGTLQDIDADKRREIELAEAREAAEQANRAKDAFLATMSHELRTPMNAILGFAQVLESEPGLHPDLATDVQEILKAGRHLLDLINDVLDLAKINSGRVDVHIEPVPIDEVIEECEHIVQPLLATHHVRLVLSPASGLQVLADRLRLKQVLLNLLSNAIKYNRPQGWVTVGVSAVTGPAVRIEVQDSGQGIPRESMSSLFEPFKRLGAEKTDVEGTGIGLSIVQALVRRMKGEIGVDSELGVGSLFHVTLPLAYGTPGRVRGDPGPTMWPDMTMLMGMSHRILYMDDNLADLRLLERAMRAVPDLVLEATQDVHAGLASAMAEPPDLILMDVNIAGVDGYQVLEWLRSAPQTRHVPVMALTADAMPEQVARGRAAGFHDYLIKPIDIPLLFEKIRSCLHPGEPAHFSRST